MYMTICVFLSLRSGLGYILGSSAKVAAGDWHWALRVRACILQHCTQTCTQRQMKSLSWIWGQRDRWWQKHRGCTHGWTGGPGPDIVEMWQSKEARRRHSSHIHSHQHQLSLQPREQRFLKGNVNIKTHSTSSNMCSCWTPACRGGSVLIRWLLQGKWISINFPAVNNFIFYHTFIYPRGLSLVRQDQCRPQYLIIVSFTV